MRARTRRVLISPSATIMPIRKTDAATTSSAPTRVDSGTSSHGSSIPAGPHSTTSRPRSAVAQRLGGARDEEEADASREAHRSAGRQVVPRIGDRRAEARREQRDAGDEQERQVHHGVAQPADASAQLQPAQAPLDGRGRVAEEDPRQHRDGGEAQHGGDPRQRSPVRVEFGDDREDRLAEDDHDQQPDPLDEMVDVEGLAQPRPLAARGSSAATISIATARPQSTYCQGGGTQTDATQSAGRHQRSTARVATTARLSYAAWSATASPTPAG